MAERNLSVIVPVYNAARYLRRCLDSLLGQTYRELEIICVNDGSTDDSAAILDAYAAKDARIQVIHQGNAGVSAARNRGLDAATGEFVTFVDADDWVEPWGYERVMGCFSDDIDVLCFGSVVEGTAPENEKLDMDAYLTNVVPGKCALACNSGGAMNGCIWNKVFRRSLLEKTRIRFFKGIAYGEDVAFCYCVAGVGGRAYAVDDRIYHYAMHESSATGRLQVRGMKVFDHLETVVPLHRFLKQNRAELRFQKCLLRDLFEYAFTYVMAHLEPEFHTLAMKEAYRIARAVRIHDCYTLPCIRQIVQLNQSLVWRVFRRFKGNCVGYGILGRSLVSATYEKTSCSWRVLGVPIFTQKNDEE